MSSADHSALEVATSRPVGVHRRSGDPDRVRTTQRWTVWVLSLATVALLAHVAAVVAATWFVVAAVTTVTAREPVPLDLLAVAADVAPVLLVGWCTGLATSAALAGGETLGARVAGVTSGAVGIAAAAAVLAVAGPLL